MNKNLTFIAVVLDRSGSMSSVKEATISGFNAFLDEQRSAQGEALFTLTTFASDVLTSEPVPIGAAVRLNEDNYFPDGGTALYDAMGSTIDEVGRRLSAMREEDRPGKVIVMIQTDGQENSSYRYARQRVKAMMKHQREKYSWEFVFIGTTEAALADALDMGVHFTKGAVYAGTAAGTAGILRGMSAGTSKYRAMVSNNATEAELQDMDYFAQVKP